MTSKLHLPSLSIEGFRGIRSLDIEKLGRITLFAGKNSIGKTTVLEAVRVFASRGAPYTISDLLDAREEVLAAEDGDGDEVLLPDFSSLFYGYNPDDEHSMSSPINIATTQNKPSNVSLSLIKVKEEMDNEMLNIDRLHLNSISVSVDGHKRIFPINQARRWLRSKSLPTPEGWPPSIPYQSFGPGLPDNDRIAALWDEVALTQAEEFATNALGLVTGPTLERLAVVGNGGKLATPVRRYHSRRVVAKLSSMSHPVPLKRLGDGAQRLLGIALALANCQNGILLIDEVENGIHYSILGKLWDMVFKAAKEGNIQVIAATHSWDCISSFANSALKTDEKGMLVRLEGSESGLYPVHYSEDDLAVAAEQRIEVR